jgi:hypothetical protein
VFTIPIPKEILVGTFWYHFLAGTRFSLKKGAPAPFLSEKGGTGPLFDTPSPPFAEKWSSRQTSNSNQNTSRPVKSDTGKKPIPKKLLVTPWYLLVGQGPHRDPISSTPKWPLK